MAGENDHEFSNGWSRYQNLILAEMKRLADGIEALEAKLAPIIVEAALSRAMMGELSRRMDGEFSEIKENVRINTVHRDNQETRLRAMEEGNFTVGRKLAIENLVLDVIEEQGKKGWSKFQHKLAVIAIFIASISMISTTTYALYAVHVLPH